MRLLLLRLAFTVLAIVVVGLLGEMAARSRGALIGAVLGGLGSLASIVVLDSLRGSRLMHWFARAREEPVPRAPGFWGEFADRAERRLRELERDAQAERLRLAEFVSAMEAAPGGVLLLSGFDQIEWCNSLAAHHFGLDPERDRLQRVTNLIRSPAFVGYLQAGHFEEPISFPDPRGQGSLQVVIRRYGADSKLVLSQDLTERERAELMRRDFVANVSHEIRTPLTVLSGFLETLRDLQLTEAETKRVIDLMVQQADRMTSLVGDLLTLAKLEGSPRPNSDKWVCVSHIFAQVEAEVRALSAGRHTIAFADASDAQIAGMESEQMSAVGNLVNNAVRYTPDKGHIDINWISCENGAGEIRVSDTGRGVAREHLSRLTERFYRVDGSRSRDSGGTGLGLAIVKHVPSGTEANLISRAKLTRVRPSAFCFPRPEFGTASRRQSLQLRPPVAATS